MPAPARTRPTYPCPADLIICPRCRNPIHHVHVGDGWTTTTCQNNHDGGRCDQHLFLVSVSGGAALVTTLTRQEADDLRRAQKAGREVSPHRVFEELGAYKLNR